MACLNYGVKSEQGAYLYNSPLRSIVAKCWAAGHPR